MYVKRLTACALAAVLLAGCTATAPVATPSTPAGPLPAAGTAAPSLPPVIPPAIADSAANVVPVLPPQRKVRIGLALGGHLREQRGACLRHPLLRGFPE